MLGNLKNETRLASCNVQGVKDLWEAIFELKRKEDM
jgi:hypothetical protein